MVDIYTFPTDSVKKKLEMEQRLRRELKKFGLWCVMEDEIMDRMKSFLDLIDNSFIFRDQQVPASSIDQIIFLQDQIHTLIWAIIGDRLNVEIELYNLRHRDELEN